MNCIPRSNHTTREIIDRAINMSRDNMTDAARYLRLCCIPMDTALRVLTRPWERRAYR